MRIKRGPTLAAGTLAMAAALAGCASGATSSAGAQSRPAASASVQWIPAPKTPAMAQIAAEMHARLVADHCGGGEAFGVIDSGTVILGKERLGVNVFSTAALRDSWRTATASMGITIVAQGQWWVAYKDLSQAATGAACN
jgi:hypothetical protein